MGLFSGMAESRVKQILRGYFGFEVPVNFIFSGILDSPTLAINGYTLNLNPFYAAVNNGGIYFIHKSEIRLAITWDDILIIKEYPNDAIVYSDTLEIYFYKEVVALSGMYKLEYPYCFWHKLRLKIFKDDQRQQFMDEFLKIKEANGIFTGGLEVFREWIENGTVREPVPREQYLEVNKDWATDKIREDSWTAWGELNDATRFTYYVGRNVALGQLPSHLMDSALNEWKKYDIANSKFTGITTFGNDALLGIVERTKQKVNEIQDKFKENAWEIKQIDTQINEWQSTMVMSKRLACIKKSKNEKIILNDFYK
jgi:hypothetical protein